MAIIKCKMCGGDLEVVAESRVAVCEYCGTQQTVPSADNEKKLTLFGRANRLRMACEFDKAAGVYESIVADFPEEAEAYWGLVLCKYGIEYVDDPATGKKIPTCHRSSFDSVMDDNNLDQALENADVIAQKVYREEAKQFERIRKGILEVSSSEKPYDIFICYKETDEKGDRTLDSVMAQDLYAALTDKGYRVFFSRITLQGKLGEAYEPYIFAALNSAKVMLAVGTCYEYYNAVWVKNEWSRYLKICEADKSKHLIPCYKDLDPEDMPREFKHLQGADLGKMGAVQDILFNMEKYIPLKKETVKETVVVQQSAETTKVQALLERAFLFLEDGDWKAANEYCEKVLDIDPKCAEGYLGKLMIDLKVTKREDLKDCDEPFNNNSNYNKAVRFSDALREELEGHIAYIENRNQEAAYEAVVAKMNNASTEEEYKRAAALFEGFGDYKDAKQLVNDCYDKAEFARRDDLYNRARHTMETKGSEVSYKEAAGLFESIGDHRDAAVLVAECLEKAEEARKDAILTEAGMYMQGGLLERYNAAIRLLDTIPSWKDADEKIGICKRAIANLEETARANAEAARLERERQEEAARLAEVRKVERKKRAKKIATICAVLVVAAIVALFVAIKVVIPKMDYSAVLEIYGEEYVSAFEEIKVGDIYTFGSYEQDNDLANGAEAIEWQVIADEGTKILVVSKYVLDFKGYGSILSKGSWDTSSLRKWLNDEFIDTAFSEEEQTMIPVTRVSADKNPEYKTTQGSATKDKVFLLSAAELNEYLESEEMRAAKLTKYAREKLNDSASAGGWVLRSSGSITTMVAYVGSDSGRVYYDGKPISNSFGVRPAMWIDLNA